MCELIFADLFVGEPQFFQHGEVFFDGGTGGGEHVAGDGGRGSGLEGSGAVFREEFAAGGQADIGLGIDEAEDGYGAEDIFCRQRRLSFHVKNK